ncbi:hypothetical protein AP285_06840 [Limnospira platensis YZ]|nr:hypothetical protein AP285_06840 [Arthrospira platensis YZ]KDR58912.1 hypothetical protein APPUASWS_002380 [Arthrospira platensis str. Paraca]BAI89380.1 hypothetical protein NIES39_C05140 [Arthrospira platensis NIES-39]
MKLSPPPVQYICSNIYIFPKNYGDQPHRKVGNILRMWGGFSMGKIDTKGCGFWWTDKYRGIFNDLSTVDPPSPLWGDAMH